MSVDALVVLGVNKWHTLSSFIRELSRVDAEKFKAFKNRDARNEKTGKSWEEKVLQNLQVLQRIHDYSLKLLQVGAVIDLQRGAKEIEVRLNTHSREPQKLGRAKKTTKTAKTIAKAAKVIAAIAKMPERVVKSKNAKRKAA